MTAVTASSQPVPGPQDATFDLRPNACRHDLSSSPGDGAPHARGTVAVIGAGKMGLPLAVQFATHRWHSIAVDIQQSVVDSINAGRSHIHEEPGLDELVARVHRERLLEA